MIVASQVVVGPLGGGGGRGGGGRVAVLTKDRDFEARDRRAPAVALLARDLQGCRPAPTRSEANPRCGGGVVVRVRVMCWVAKAARVARRAAAGLLARMPTELA